MSIKKMANGQYQVRFRDESKRQRAKSFARKKDAEAFEAKVKTEVNSGLWLDPVVAHVNLEDIWIDFYELKKGKKKNTLIDYENIWRNHLAPRWGKVSVFRIDQIEFDKWVIGKKLSPQRIGKIHLIMSMLLDHAVKRKNLKHNPLKDALGRRSKENLPTASVEIATNFLTLGQLMKVAERARFYRDVVLVLGLCGLRWGELVGLQVKDLNVSAGTITIRRSLVEINGKLEESTTKTYRWRIVHLPAILQTVCHRWVFDKNQDDPLFHTEESTFLRNTNFTRRIFAPALLKAEVKKIRIHDLRHTAASIAISAGATPNMVKEMLGHSDVQLTMRVYAHIFEADREKVAANVNRAVNEVHEMCTDPLETEVLMRSTELINPSDQHFLSQTGNQFDSGTSDYEFGSDDWE
jgi:integrase